MSRTTAPVTSPGTWASDRLALGQANVGFWVILSAAVSVVPLLLPQAHPTVQWTTVCVVLPLLQWPFDAWGGLHLPRKHGRWPIDTASWLSKWARGAAVQVALWTVIGLTALSASRAGGPALALLTLGVWMVALLAAQGPLAVLTGGLRPTTLPPGALPWSGPPDQVQVVESADPGFAGSWVGLPGLETLIVPARWVERWPRRILHTALLRRETALREGHRTLGLMSAVIFHLVGAMGLVWWNQWSLATVDELILLGAGMTLWTFLGLLTLPTASRWAVYRIDHAVDQRVGRSLMTELIATADVDQEDTLDRPDLVETIFHPVPSPSRRVTRLHDGTPTDGVFPYRVTRTMLFTSLAMLTPLGRAVHCNCGRPELWTIHPGD